MTGGKDWRIPRNRYCVNSMLGLVINDCVPHWEAKVLFHQAFGAYGLRHSHWPSGREVANSIYQIFQCQIITNMNVFYGEHHFLMKLNLPNSLDSIISDLPVDKKISQTSFMHLLFSHDLWAMSKYTYIISERHSWQRWSEQDPEWHGGTKPRWCISLSSYYLPVAEFCTIPVAHSQDLFFTKTYYQSSTALGSLRVL